MTRQHISTNKQPLLRSSHAKRPPQSGFVQVGLWAVICCFCVYVLTEIHSGPEVGFQKVTMIEAFVA